MKKRLNRISIFAVIAAALLMATLTFKSNATTYPETFSANFAAIAAEATPAGTYAIDPVHTTIGFTVHHLVINTVPGRFREFSGAIQYDPDKIASSSVTFTAKATSIDTGVEARDNHLRSADFFNVAQYPEITFKSTRIEKNQNGFVAYGDFTLHGVTKQVAIPFTLYGLVKDPWGKTRLGIEAGLTINRQDYGVAWSQKLDNGGLVVSNDVKINLFVEAVKQEAKATPATGK